MQNLKSRLGNLEQNGRGGKPIIVVVAPDETEAEAFTRLGIDRVKLPPDQLVVIIDRNHEHVR